MSTPTPTSLDAFTFPLHGSRLIEASAGTGKTYTIANLYLRIILGHGDDSSRHNEPLSVDKILVVTFTEAATGELRDRIRARIHEARMAFIDGSSNDPDISRLLTELDDHEYCAGLLLIAEQQMDEAAVFTIHGFCQRMLKQHAFESGTLFSSELVSDIEHLLQTSVADFWRKNLYQLDKPMATLVRDQWKTPTDLLKEVRGWLGLSSLEVQGNNLPESLQRFQEQALAPWLKLKEDWRKDYENIAGLLENCGLKGRCKPLSRLKLMTEFVLSDQLMPNLNPNHKREGWEIYSSEVLDKNLKKNCTLPEHPVFAQIDHVLANYPTPTEALRGTVLRDALHFIREQLARLKSARHQLSFDDLLGNLARALNNDDAGMLADAIRGQYRIAMIDEFQDTDPLQYDIFRKIYIETNDRHAGLFMIGDPKQAIYAFRGADIFTYMQARQQVSAHYNLETNWRSTAGMVASVNAVFEHANRPFIYDNDIPFDAVNPSPRSGDKQLLIEGEASPAMKLWLDTNGGETVSSGAYQETMTAATVAEIKRLLTLADQDQCIIRSTKDGDKRVQPGDIAVLVRTGHQGQMVRNALQAQGISSIYLSNSDSVFSSKEATDVLRILHACLSPTNERTLKGALASGLLHENARSLDELNHDEELWEAAVKEFTDYQKIWQSQGVLPMLRTLLNQRGIAEQLLACDYGERRLTDLLHIGQLLSAASQNMESLHGLTRWLSEQIENPNSNADDQQLHLESERNLVKIVTIHKSKGLEYNMVFLPFICSHRPAESPLFHDEQSGKAILELTYDGQSMEQAEKERLAEDLRLLYVALTRSVHCCYLGLAPFRPGRGKSPTTDLHLAAIGYLLNKGESIEAAELSEKVAALAQASGSIHIETLPELSADMYQPPEPALQELEPRAFTGNIVKNWWVTSYSALSRHSHSGAVKKSSDSISPDASMETAGHDTEDSGAILEAPVDEFSLFEFPRGARPGTFMHTLFEELDMDKAHQGELTDYVKEQLAKEGYEEHWTPALEQMLQQCLKAPLDGGDMRLMDIPEPSRCVEMEFYLPVNKLNCQALNQLIRRHDPLSADAGELVFDQVQGMLKGFIDLTFEYQGRWYVLDYKSNWLGAETSDYSRENMQAMMISHRYDLQYQLYSLALHRLLKQRLPDYDYSQHFGGVIYLFLRGVQENDSERHGVFDHCPSKEFIEELDNLFAGHSVDSPSNKQESTPC